MESIEITMKVDEIRPGCIFIVSKHCYYNTDGSFTIIRDGVKMILKKSLFKPYIFDKERLSKSK